MFNVTDAWLSPPALSCSFLQSQTAISQKQRHSFCHLHSCPTSNKQAYPSPIILSSPTLTASKAEARYKFRKVQTEKYLPDGSFGFSFSTVRTWCNVWHMQPPLNCINVCQCWCRVKCGTKKLTWGACIVHSSHLLSLSQPPNFVIIHCDGSRVRKTSLEVVVVDGAGIYYICCFCIFVVHFRCSWDFLQCKHIWTESGHGVLPSR